MLHILFLILKIIGIILLSILGIVLTLIVVVLFVPIRYRAKIETTDGVKKLRVEAKVTWLLHLISAHVAYKENKLVWQARVAWKKLNGDKKSTNKEMKETVEEQPKGESQEQISDTRNSEFKHNEHDETQQETTNETSVKSSKQKSNWFEKIKCTIVRIYDKIRKIKQYLTDETNLKAILRIKNELFYILKKVKPTKLNGFIRFGMEDPYQTGRVLAVLSILYPFYGEYFEIYPEFDREIIEGDVSVKGRIRLYYFIIVACRMFFDSNVKKAYKNMEIFKE